MQCTDEPQTSVPQQQRFQLVRCEPLLSERRAAVIFRFAGPANIIAAEPALACIIDTLSRLENEVPVEANASFMSLREAGLYH